MPSSQVSALAIHEGSLHGKGGREDTVVRHLSQIGQHTFFTWTWQDDPETLLRFAVEENQASVRRAIPWLSHIQWVDCVRYLIEVRRAIDTSAAPPRGMLYFSMHDDSQWTWAVDTVLDAIGFLHRTVGEERVIAFRGACESLRKVALLHGLPAELPDAAYDETFRRERHLAASDGWKGIATRALEQGLGCNRPCLDAERQWYEWMTDWDDL